MNKAALKPSSTFTAFVIELKGEAACNRSFNRELIDG